MTTSPPAFLHVTDLKSRVLVLTGLLAKCTLHTALAHITTLLCIVLTSQSHASICLHIQELLQQMLHSKPRSSAAQSPTSPSLTVNSRPLTAARTTVEPPHPAQPKHSVAAAPKSSPISKQSSGRSACDDSVLPFECHQGTETARRGVSTPVSSRSWPAASAQESHIPGKQAVSLVAKPELYSALTAVVSAIVQQSGLAQCQPAKDCLEGISQQYHAEGQGLQPEGQGAQLEGQGTQLEGQGAQLEEQGAQLQGQGAKLEGQGAQLEGQGVQLEGQGALPEGQGAELEGHTEGVRRQQTCTEGQHAGHEGQQAWHGGQQQEAFPSSSEAPATVFATSLPSHMASQNSCRQAHLGQVSVQQRGVNESQTQGQHAQHTHHAQRGTAGANGTQSTSGQQVTYDKGHGGVAAGQGGLAIGQGGLDEGSGRVQAWQTQIEQAMQVLQAALQSSSKAGDPPAGVTTR